MDDEVSIKYLYKAHISWYKLPTMFIFDVTSFNLVDDRLYAITSKSKLFPDKQVVTVVDMHNPNLLSVEFFPQEVDQDLA